MSRNVNDEHPEWRRDCYRPVVMSEDKTNMFSDAVALARLRRESFGSPDTKQFERLALALPRPSSFSDDDVRLIGNTTFPLLLSSVATSWTAGAVHAAWIVGRTMNAEPGVRRARLFRALRGWALLPLAIVAVGSATLLPAAMVLHGTDMGYKFHVARARSYGASGDIDPWTKSLIQIEREQEQYENVVLPALPQRPDHPAHFGTAAAAIGSDEDVTKVAADWSRGVQERYAASVEVRLKAAFDQKHAADERHRRSNDIERKNAMIARNAQASIAQAKREPAEKSINDDE